jgi:hypothetical protein
LYVDVNSGKLGVVAHTYSQTVFWRKLRQEDQLSPRVRDQTLIQTITIMITKIKSVYKCPKSRKNSNALNCK